MSLRSDGFDPKFLFCDVVFGRSAFAKSWAKPAQSHSGDGAWIVFGQDLIVCFVSYSECS